MDLGNSELSTHAVRKMLEEMGAVKPGKRAVAMIATQASGMNRWDLRYPDERIKAAVEACDGMRGEESYRTFEAALKSTTVPEQ